MALPCTYSSMKYRLIDHTADFGIHVFGSDLKDLFTNAALAMFDLITDINDLKIEEKCILTVKGSDHPDLMVNWLRELLYIWNGKQKLVAAIDILSIAKYELTANIKFDSFEPAVHCIRNEIKAVTYHQIQVSRAETGWESKIIFDA
ncbi:MAG: archease [Thermodesulfobacteriota bacterium]|nr:archease [Thermodesulfobacteriota bacterium]